MSAQRMSFFEKQAELLRKSNESEQPEYETRPGRADGEGVLFEVLAAALAFLRCVRQRLTFLLSSNDTAGGKKFDDLVLTWQDEDKGQKEGTSGVNGAPTTLTSDTRDEDSPSLRALFVQQKYKTSPRKINILFDHLTKKSEDFCISNFYDCYANIRKSLNGGNYALVMYTNSTLGEEVEHMFITPDSESSQWMKLLESGGCVYKLNPHDEDVKRALENGDNQFIQNFYLFCGQSNNESMKDKIRSELQIILAADEISSKSMCEDLCSSISEWMRKHKFYLRSDWKSWLNIVDSYIKKEVTTCNSLVTRIKYCNVEAVQEYVESHNPAWIRPPGREAMALTATKVHQIIRDEKHIMVSVRRLSDLQEKILHCWGPFCPWLVLVDDTEERCDILRRMVELAGPERHLLIVSQKGDDFFEDKYRTGDIPDDTWKELTNVEIRLNSEQHSCRLGDLCDTEALKIMLDENPEALAALSQLTGPVRMGHNLDPLPNNHIDRRLISRMHVREEFFSKLGDYDVCIMDNLSYKHLTNVSVNKTVKFEELENYLCASNAVWPLFSVTDIIDLHVIQMICSNFQNMCVYVLSYEEDGWKMLFLHRGSAKILPYVKEQSRSLWQIVDSLSSRIIVDGKPGIGKSTFLLDIANQVKRKNPSWWILRINLLTYSEVFNSSSSSFEAVNDILLRVVYSEKNVGILEHLLLQHCLKEYAHIFCLVDGFDEICPDYAEKCLQALQQLAPRRGKLVVANRPSVTDRLEAAMGVLAHSLPAFTEEEVHRFHQAGKLGVTHVGVELLKIPLFSRMYAETLESGIVVDDTVSLYETFFERKFIRLYREKWGEDLSKPGMKRIFEMERKKQENHLGFLAVSHLLPKLQVPCAAQSSSIDRDELVMAGVIYQFIDDKPVFIHRTFAEYFLAKWCLSHVVKSECAKVYQTALSDNSLEFFVESFDRMASRGRPLLTAVLNGSESEVESLLLEGADPADRDEMRRNSLHLAAAYNRESTDSTLLWLLVRRLEMSGAETLGGSASVGQAIGGGDCFFDSVAKGLKQLKPEMDFTVKSLREVCKRFAQNQLENDQSWLKGALRNEAEPISVYVPRIEFTADDIEQKSGSVNVLGLTSPIWGRSEIEERIICKEYNVKLHVVEKHVVEGKEVWLDQIVNSEGSRSVDSIDYNEENTIHIINRGNAHFEPILGTQEIRHNKQQSPDPSDYDDEITPEEELVSTIKSSESEGEKLARIKRLFDKEPKPNINFQGVNGNTPLHIAVRKKELKVIEYLVKNGAKIDIKNGKSRTSLDIAKRLQRQDIVQILESRIQQVFVEEQSAEQKKSSKENKLEYIGQKNERVEQEKRISYSDKLLLENKGEVSINQVEQHKFNRRQGTAGISGQLYEINLSMLFLLQGVTKKEDGKIDSFYLATNMEEAGDFDDVVFKYKYKDQGGIEKSKIIFLQAKHREKVKKEISLKTLLAESEKGDFLLKKYFSSYREIKQQFSEKGNVGDPIFGSNFKDSDFIIYTNALFTYGTSEEKNIKKIDEEKESILNLKEENNHYYQLTFGGNKEKKIIDTLKYSSDCKKLAKELAECIFSGEVININKPIFGKYHTALVEKVIEKNKLKESTLRKSFLDGDESLSPGDKKFREAFFEEIQKIGELESGLSGKGIKLHKKFGDAKRNDPKLPLPSDLVNEDEIKEFLSKLKLFVGRVNEGELGKVVKQKIQSTYKVEQNDVNLIFSDVQNKIQKWWKEENKYLTENNKLFEDAKQNLSKLNLIGLAILNTGRIERLELGFKSDQIRRLTELIREKQILNVVTNKSAAVLSSAKVYQALESMIEYKSEKYDYRYIFMSLSSVLNLQNKVIDTFKSERSNLLVIECKATKENIDELYNQLSGIIKSNNSKRIVLITQEDDPLAKKFKGDFFQDNKYEEKIDEENSLTDLTTESQEKLLEEGKVIFQEEEVSLGTLINQESKYIVDAEVLSKLISNEKIEIGKALTDLGEIEYYYIGRIFNRQVKIRQDFEKERFKFFVTRSSQVNEQELKEGQDIVLISDIGNDFKELCDKYKKNNIHWLKKEGNEYIWQRSHNELTNLREFVDTRSDGKYKVQANEITNIADRVVIVSAEPGMGKSTVLTKLAQETKKSDSSLWVVRVNLNDHTKDLSKISFSKNQDQAIDFFLSNIVDLKTPLEQELLKRRINDHGKVALLFDGFDEISPTYKEKVIKLVKILKDTKVEKLWVTTRPHMRSTLEDELSTLSYTLKSLSREDQENFFKRFWNKGLDLKMMNGKEDDSRLNVYVQKLLDLLKRSTADKEVKFTGIPLQTRMLAEAFQDKFKEFYNSDQDKPDLPKKLDLIDLYQRFIDKKYNIYCEEKKKQDITNVAVTEDDDELRGIFRQNHQKAALYTLFNKDELRFYDIQTQRVNEFVKKVKDGKEKTGIIYQVTDDKPSFIHRTFAEYFAADWFTDNKDVKKVKDFLRKKIFEKENDVLRNFFDRMLAKDEQGENKYEIHRAVLNNDEQTVKDLLKQDGNIINTTDKAGRTALHLAAAYDHLGIVQVLLEHGANVSIEDKVFGWRPLSYADKGNCWSIAELLLQKGANGDDMFEAKSSIKSHSAYGEKETLLHIAAKEGYIEFAKVLVEKLKANFRATDNYNRIPLHLAAGYGKLKIVEFLLNKDKETASSKDYSGKTPLDLAVYRGQLEVVQYLGKKSDLSRRELNEMQLNAAASSGDYEVVKILLEKKVNVNSEVLGWTPLHQAAMDGSLKVVQILVENGAKIDHLGDNHPNPNVRDGWTPLHGAANNGHYDIVKYLVKELIKKEADINPANKDGYTPLHTAARKGHLNVVKYFIEELKVDINVADEKGTTSLHAAAFHGRYDIVKYLVEKKANINAIDKWGATVVFSAACYNDHKIINFLLDEKANIDSDEGVIGELSITVLHVAAMYGALEIVKRLVENENKDVNAGKDSFTPLHLAALSGDSKVIKYLINKGAEVNALISFSNIVRVLEDEGRVLENTSMNTIIKKLIISSKYLTDLVELTPRFIYEILEYEDKESLALLKQNQELMKEIFHIVKTTITVYVVNKYIKKQVSMLKEFISEKKERGDLYLLEQNILDPQQEEKKVSDPVLEECLPSTSSGRSKREVKIGECELSWEDVDEFNTEKDEKRDFSKIKIDGEKFINYIKGSSEEKKFSTDSASRQGKGYR